MDEGTGKGTYIEKEEGDEDEEGGEAEDEEEELDTMEDVNDDVEEDEEEGDSGLPPTSCHGSSEGLRRKKAANQFFTGESGASEPPSSFVLLIGEGGVGGESGVLELSGN